MRRWSLVLCLVAAACGTSEKAPPPANVNAFTLDQYLAADAAFGCLAYGCLFGIAPSELPAFCGNDDNGAGDKRKAVAAGRMRFDAEKAKSCVPALTGYDAKKCWGPAADFGADVDRLLATCDGVLTGLVADGGDCVRSEECATGYCDATLQVCPGKCVPKRAEGGACSAASMCAAGLACVASKCVAAAGPSEACGASRPCRSGLWCDSGTCAAPLAKGAACDPEDDHCATAFYCTADGTCADRLPAGATCALGSVGTLGISSPQCAGNQVCVGLVLDEDGAVLFPGKCGSPSDLGGSCAPPNGRAGADPADSGCFQGIACDGATSQCRHYPGPGEACPDVQCDQAAYCDAGTCRALKKDGESCTKSSECEHLCSNGHCAAAAATTCHAN